MSETIKILTIQDISCYGQCSITVALPVISAFGIETAVLPSAVLSTHTSGFTDFTVRDLTEDLPEIRKHWEKEGIYFDAIYTGFIASKEQLDYIKDIIDSRLKPDGLVFVDPAMADHGEFYNEFTQEFADAMGELCKLGDYILPNTTEACYILHKPWKETFSKDEMIEMAKELKAFTNRYVILKGYENDDKMGMIVLDKKEETCEIVYNDKVNCNQKVNFKKALAIGGNLWYNSVVTNITTDSPLRSSARISERNGGSYNGFDQGFYK